MSRENSYVNTYRSSVNAFGTAIVDGNFPATTLFEDTTEYVHFRFYIKAGVLDSAMTCQVMQDTSATVTAGIKVVTDAVVVVGATQDGQQFMIEVETARLDIQNDFRFVTLAISGAATGDDFLSIDFEGGIARRAPVTQPANYPLANTALVVG